MIERLIVRRADRGDVHADVLVADHRLVNGLPLPGRIFLYGRLLHLVISKEQNVEIAFFRILFFRYSLEVILNDPVHRIAQLDNPGRIRTVIFLSRSLAGRATALIVMVFDRDGDVPSRRILGQKRDDLFAISSAIALNSVSFPCAV